MPAHRRNVLRTSLLPGLNILRGPTSFPVNQPTTGLLEIIDTRTCTVNTKGHTEIASMAEENTGVGHNR